MQYIVYIVYGTTEPFKRQASTAGWGSIPVHAAVKLSFAVGGHRERERRTGGRAGGLDGWMEWDEHGGERPTDLTRQRRRHRHSQ